jgi:hypothetical protein
MRTMRKIAEIYKSNLHLGHEPTIHFWRTAAGAQVDVVVETQPALIPVEIKASATTRPDMAREIINFRRDFGVRAASGYVIYPGETLLPLGEGVLALPVAAL